MEFINQFKEIRKTGTNLYSDLETAWCEYEYVKDVILKEIDEIVKKHYGICEQEGFRDNFYCQTSLDDLANIIVIVKPAIHTKAVQEIEELLGIPAIISIQGDKKNPKIRLKFTKIKKQEDKDNV